MASLLHQPSFILTGESGAVTLGALYKICSDPTYAEMKAKLGIDGDSRILLVSTEGDTDPEGFQNIVNPWKYIYKSTKMTGVKCKEID